MLPLLKIGGLGVSALLTLMFFTDLFGLTPVGISLAVSALVLYEGGAFAWAKLLAKARHGQIIVAKIGLWVCVGLSVLTSVFTVVSTSGLAARSLEGLDLEFISLCCFALALASNIICAIAFEAETPEVKQRATRLARMARMAALQESQENAALDAAEAESRAQIDAQARVFGAMLASGAMARTQRAMQRLAREEEMQTIEAPAYTLRPIAPTNNGGGARPTGADHRARDEYDDDSRYFFEPAPAPSAPKPAPVAPTVRAAGEDVIGADVAKAGYTLEELAGLGKSPADIYKAISASIPGVKREAFIGWYQGLANNPK